MNPLDQELRRAYAMDVQRREARSLPAWKRAEREGFLACLHDEGAITLLEIGAGTGTDAGYFSEGGMDVTCIDLTPEMIDACCKKGLRALTMDVRRLDFEKNTFDAVYSMNCLLHLPKAEFGGALSEVHRVLRSRGLFYLGLWGGFDHEGVYADDVLTPPRFFSFFEDARLQQLTHTGYDLLDFHIPYRAKDNPQLHFQSLTLRAKKGTPWN